ncbi:MAG: hypothetical protein IJZ06_02220 [Bacteroidales bacterium]|nr:hypothetical protein [Bacteroidales bacterium]
MKKIALFFLMMFAFFSCSENELVEEVITKHENGNKKEVRYHKVNEDGSKTCVRETWYYEEGMKYLDGPIADGKRNGIFESYFKSGIVMSRGEFIDGKRVGKATVYHENGKVRYEGVYENGVERGIWKFYDEEGNFMYEVNRD